MMNALTQDARHAARSLVKNPVFTIVSVITLAIGIGANTAIFSFVNALLLTPLPYKDPDRLVRVMSQRGNEAGKLSMLEITELNELAFSGQTKAFEGFASFRNSQYNVTGDGPPEALTASINSYNLFDLLGVKPHLGATWPASHERQRVFAVVLSFKVWKHRFAADPGIVGKKIMLDGAEYEVLGVMPQGFHFPLSAELYRRVPPADFDSRAIRESSATARLKAGVTIEQAQAELDGITKNWENLYPDTNTGLQFQLAPLREQYIGGAGQYLWMLFGAVGFVLLIACVNVVNLMLARSLARGKEMAVRAALGANRRRLMQQVLTESLLLTLSGGVFGLALAYLSVEFLSDFMRLELPSWMAITIDVQVLLFTLVISILVGLLAGLGPALQGANPNLSDALKDSAKGSSGGSLGQRARRVLVIAQVALSLVLLVGAGLMINSFIRLQQVPLGFAPAGLLTMKMDPPWTKYSLVEQTAPFYKRVIEEVERIPGVQAAAFNDSLPLATQDVQEGANRLTLKVEGQTLSEREGNPYVNAQIVSPTYFRAMEMNTIAGRLFDERDRQGTTQMIVISERLAKRFWEGQEPLGKRLRIGKRSQNYRPSDPDTSIEEPWLTVGGVVNDVRQRGVLSEAGLDVYLCDQQLFAPESYLVVRTAGNPMTFVQAVKQAVWKIDPEQSVFDIQAMEQRVMATIWHQRLAGLVMLLFAALALALAGVGIYGVMSYLVSQRRREIGLRMALGAQTSDVLKLIVGQGLRLVLTGVVIGLALALVLKQVIASLLFGVTSGEPFTFIAVALLLVLVALVACYLPARRAAKIDPMIALRSE